MRGDEHARSIIASPVDGHAMAIADVSDPMFAAEVMGPSAAVVPSGSSVLAPADGIVTLVARTKHAITMRTDEGAELLIHIGIDTNGLLGGPFELHVDVGDRVNAGDVLADADFGLIRDAGLDPTVIVVLMNRDGFGAVVAVDAGPLRAGDPLMEMR